MNENRQDTLSRGTVGPSSGSMGPRVREDDVGFRAAVLRRSLPVLGMFMANLVWAADAPANVDAVVAKAAKTYMAAAQSVGLSIGVVHAGKAHRYHFGSVSKERVQTPNDQTIYPIASITKTFAGTLLARAELDKKLRIDDDVARHLGAGYPNLAFDKQPVRLFHLLNHRSGLPFILPDRPEAAPGFENAIMAASSRADFYADLHRVKLTTAPGTRFDYSNAAAQLAGYILEGVYASTFETLVKQRIAAPLGMRDTFITATTQQQSRLVSGYDENGVRQSYSSDKFQAAGALKSTLPDMLTYAQWHLAERDPAVRLSHQATHTSDNYSVGLNWQMLKGDARRVIWQDGADPGFGSLLVVHPESGIAIILMVNQLDGSTLGRLRTLANGIASSLDTHSLAVP